MKHILGVALLLGDAILGTAAKTVMHNLHHESRIHLYAAILVYLLFAVVTVYMLTSVMRRKPENANRSAAPRPTGYPYGNGPRR